MRGIYDINSRTSYDRLHDVFIFGDSLCADVLGERMTTALLLMSLWCNDYYSTNYYRLICKKTTEECVYKNKKLKLEKVIDKCSSEFLKNGIDY